MACLIKLPTANSKGVVTFTTPEQRAMAQVSQLSEMLNSIREKYVIGLHFNWHNFQFKPDSSFDFFMAGEGDLIPVDDTSFHLLPMDACNFTPEIYRPELNEKFWDLLIAGNPVTFKRPEVALRAVRKLFDQSKRNLRVLYICPMPKYVRSDRTSVFYDIREYYESLFTSEERGRFTLLTTTFNSPFPFERKTLSVFFKNSRVFLHCATEERRCRIAAYAWCAGLPVVAYQSVASILPSELRQEPGYFEVVNDIEYAPKIIQAIESSEKFKPEAYRQHLSEVYTVDKLDRKLAEVFEGIGLLYQKGDLLARNLDIRLGWHHQGLSGHDNGLMQPFDQFMLRLLSIPNESKEVISLLRESEYPERFLAGEESNDNSKRDESRKVEKKSLYLNRSKGGPSLCHAVISRIRQLGTR